MGATISKPIKQVVRTFLWFFDTKKATIALSTDEGNYAYCFETQTTFEVVNGIRANKWVIELPGARGDQGVPGESVKGEKWDVGEPGKDWQDGKDGKDGKDWKDGQPGRDWIDWKDGQPGTNGVNGEKGEKGDKMTLADFTNEELQQIIAGLIPLIRPMLPTWPKGDNFDFRKMDASDRKDFRDFLNKISAEKFDENLPVKNVERIIVQYSVDGENGRHEGNKAWDIYMRNVVDGLGKEAILLSK